MIPTIKFERIKRFIALAGSAPTVWVGVFYFVLVMLLWGSTNPLSGMGYETTFLWRSESGPLWKGMFFPDLLRPHNSTFYHLAYLLGEVTGVGGSFVPFQIIYALLWWARGLLVFLIVLRLVPGKDLVFSYAIGALVLVHAADSSLNWVGQLNQFGYIFWMLLAFYCFILGFQKNNWTEGRLYFIAAAFFEHMSLWSYESQIFIVLALPLILLFLYREDLRASLWKVGLWYPVPLVFVGLQINRFLIKKGDDSYQAALLRPDITVSNIWNDLWFNVSHSLSFWEWEMNIPLKASSTPVLYLSILSALVFVAGGCFIYRMSRNSDPLDSSQAISKKMLTGILCVGLGLVVLSFPAYLLTTSSRMFWRTQYLSGIGAALTFGAVIYLGAQGIKNIKYRMSLLILLASAIVFFGTSSAIKRGAHHYDLWEKHRRAIVQVLEVAPQVRPGSIIVLTGIPKSEDPFRENRWLDHALRLVYPNTAVAGIYYYEDGSSPPDSNMFVVGNRWRWNKKHSHPLVRETGIENTLIVRYSPEGKPRLITEWPEFLGENKTAPGLYQPQVNITDTKPSIRAYRRYLK